MKLQGKITIGRIDSNNEESHMLVELTETATCCEFCVVKIPMVEFLKALTNRGYQPCEITLVEKAVAAIINEPQGDGAKTRQD